VAAGTAGGPKAVQRSHGKHAFMARGAALMLCQATADDVVYCSMPLFHANAQILALGVALAAGCQLALCRRFSASGFLPDVRRYGCTLFPYVGSPVAYVLAPPGRPHAARPPPRGGYRNERPRQHGVAVRARAAGPAGG